MFDLDAAIRHWRGSLGESMRAEDLDELEEHLRDQVAALSGGALSGDEAFLVARSRLGANVELAGEFAKVHPGSIWVGRAQWMILGFLGVNAFSMALGLLSGMTAWGASVFGLMSVPRAGATALVQIVGVLALLWAFSRVARWPLHARPRLAHLALAFALLIPLLGLVRLVLSVIQARTLSMVDVVELRVLQSHVGTISTIAFPIVLALVLRRLERARTTA